MVIERKMVYFSFCPSCMGITQERNACPLCLNRSLANNLGALHLGGGGGGANHRGGPQANQAAAPTSSATTPSSPPFFADLNAPVSDPLTVDTSFLIWDPPKMPPQQHSSSHRPHQSNQSHLPQRRSAADVNCFDPGVRLFSSPFLLFLNYP